MTSDALPHSAVAGGFTALADHLLGPDPVAVRGVAGPRAARP